MYYAVKLYQLIVGSTDRVVVTDFVTTTFLYVHIPTLAQSAADDVGIFLSGQSFIAFV